jgi:chaperonin cofactor prefoldin
MELKRKSLLILGLVVATLAMVNSFSYADNNIITSNYDIEMQIEQLAKDILDAKIEESNVNEFHKVYNNTGQLVYETNNNKDEKLVQLIKTSDFLTEVNKISYYKLSR